MPEQAPPICKAQELKDGGGCQLLGAMNHCELPAIREGGRFGVCGRVLRLVVDEPGGAPRIEPDLNSPQCAVSAGTVLRISKLLPPADSPYL
jgi:hypothetical protein